MNYFKAELFSVISGIANLGTVLFAMTDAVSISIVTSMTSVVLAGMAAYFAHKAKLQAVDTHAAVNSRVDEFKRVVEDLFIAKGKEKEQTEARAREALVNQGIIKEKIQEEQRKEIKQATNGAVAVATIVKPLDAKP